jgi:hypothetical protein
MKKFGAWLAHKIIFKRKVDRPVSLEQKDFLARAYSSIEELYVLAHDFIALVKALQQHPEITRAIEFAEKYNIPHQPLNQTDEFKALEDQVEDFSVFFQRKTKCKEGRPRHYSNMFDAVGDLLALLKDEERIKHHDLVFQEMAKMDIPYRGPVLFDETIALFHKYREIGWLMQKQHATYNAIFKNNSQRLTL